MPVSGPYCPYCQNASNLAKSDPAFDIHEHAKVCRQPKWICAECNSKLFAPPFLLGSDDRVREYYAGLPGDKVLCSKCAYTQERK